MDTYILGFMAVAFVVVSIVLIKTLRRATMILYEALMRSSVLANFSRFGDIDPERLVVIDDARAYFIRDNALWTCDVKDDFPVQSSMHVVDVMSVKGERLKEVMTAVDALNANYDDEDGDDASV